MLTLGNRGIVTCTLTFGLILAGAALGDEGAITRIIRSPDDRTDYFATSAMLQGIGDAVCAQFGADAITNDGDGTFTIAAGTLEDQYNPLCDGERFGDQPNAASCTATLVAPDVLITAGHCLLDDNNMQIDLSTVFFVFDYAVLQEGQNPGQFSADQVYQATEYLGFAFESDDSANDWAVLRLERAVEGRTPATVRSTGALTTGEGVVGIGFGAGLPMKFSGNATVQNIIDFGFEADLDIIEGNSGGPIINAATGMIEGVVSSDLGEEDILQDGDCFRASVCGQDFDCEGGFTRLASVMITEFQTAIQNAIGAGGGDQQTDNGMQDDGMQDDGMQDDGMQDDQGGGDTGATAPPPLCGVMGLLPAMFMVVGLTLLRRRRR